MKKDYLKPTIKTLNVSDALLQSGSVTGDNGIGYGGVDTDGEQDPCAKENDGLIDYIPQNSIWDD